MKKETAEYKSPEFSINNVNRVPVKQWRKWDVQARGVFNEVYGSMMSSQRCFTHPRMVKMPAEQWKTICWNAAWVAADASN